MNVKDKTPAPNNVPNEKMTIVKEPDENDVLLGQGHYRHPGNQRLNEIIDKRVLEYKTATRPFKTYMVHEIVQRLRKKDGVRFLKELAPKGWMVVLDDKEAKEKCSQRFQYSMRKMTENPSSVVKDTNTPAKSTPPTEAVPAPQPHLVWNGTTVKVPFLPVFHQLQKSSVMVDDDINEVSQRLLECFQIIGVQESFNYEMANAMLTISENPNLKMQMNLWKPLGVRGVIVELVNLSGDVIMFQRNSRYVLEAATGFFDSYKHTLCQSRRLTTSSVQDHVATFSTNQPNSNTNAIPSANIGTSTKKSTTTTTTTARSNHVESDAKDPTTKLPVFSDGPVRDANNHKQSKTVRNSIPSSICVRRDVVPAFSETSLSDTKPTKPIYRPECLPEKKDSTVKRPSPKRVEQKKSSLLSQPTSKKDATISSTHHALHSSDSMLGRFDEAKAAFSRWESCGAKAPPPSTTKTTGRYENTNHAVRRLSLSNKVAHNNGIRANSSDMWPTIEPPVATWTAPESQSSNNNQQMKCDSSCDEDPYKSSAKTDAAGRFSLSENTNNNNNENTGHWTGPLVSENEAMKCNRNYVEGSMEHNTDSIRRLSLTDGELLGHRDTRTTGDMYEPLPLEQWGEALTNQEMKCDSSFEEDPFTENNLSSKQSWIPSTFFGTATPSTQHANRKKPSPPSPAGSFCSHISVEMRSVPSPAPSFSSRISVDVYSLPSPSNSFNSKCSLAKNSLQSARMDEAPSPSMFTSDQSDDPRASQPDSLLLSDYQSHQESAPMLGTDSSHSDAVPPTIFVDSCSIGSAA